MLGMRRAWPSTDARAVDAATRLGEQRDVGYARALRSLGLLAREMDAMEQLDASTLHDVFDESPPRWPFEGALWLARNATRVICDDAPAIIASWADAPTTMPAADVVTLRGHPHSIVARTRSIRM